jgi:hypothetical protein
MVGIAIALVEVTMKITTATLGGLGLALSLFAICPVAIFA